jgi:hypothetical protein
MAQRWNLAELHDGQVVQVPLDEDGGPEPVMACPSPADETTERSWWDTGNYYFPPLAHPPTRGQHGYYAYARTLPGYRTYAVSADGEATVA